MISLLNIKLVNVKDQKVLKTSDVYKIIQIVLKEKDIEFSTVTFKAF
jgi:hypothetical protein